MGAGPSVSSDPWAGCEAEAALARVKAEEGDTVALDDDSSGSCGGVVAALAAALAAAPTSGALRLVADECNLEDSHLAALFASAEGGGNSGGNNGAVDGAVDADGVGGSAEAAAARVICLMVSGNCLHTLSCLDAPGAGFAIRALHCGGNPTFDWSHPRLLGCAQLVELDVSYSPTLQACLRRFTGPAPPFAHLGGSLQRLVLTSCALTSLEYGRGDGNVGAGSQENRVASGSEPCWLLGGLTALQELGLAENDFNLPLRRLAAGLQPVSLSLLELELADNPCTNKEDQTAAEQKTWASALAKVLPRLRALDGKNLAVVSANAAVQGGLRLATDGRSHGGMLGDAPAMAALDKEMNANLRGHKDNALVA